MRFPRAAMSLFALFSFLLMWQSPPLLAQQRSEKAAKVGAETESSAQKSATKAKEEKKEEEKGMRYRMIGPYRG
ncbi:MAG TPA: hypothetical protein VF154_17205, partial [Terriglobales bacterium]